MGLCLSRNIGESFVIGEEIVVKVVEVGKNRVKFLVDGPRGISVMRKEVHDRIVEERKASHESVAVDSSGR